MKNTIDSFINKTKKLWANALTLQSNKKSELIRFIQIINIVKENFKQSNSNLWAATLSFYSILSIVPIIAIIFSVAKNFGFEAILRDELTQNLPIYKDVLNYTFSFATQLINSTKGSIIAGTGIITLLWTVVKIFSVIEASFNEIWKVAKARSIFRKFTDYITLILLFPVMVILSNGIAAFFKTNLPEALYNLNAFNNLLLFSLRLLPYFITSLTFSILYMVIPNTNVKVKTAIYSGILTGILFLFLQNVYLNFQIGIMTYNTIYGSFSIIPIYLIWQRVIWILVLLGAHFSFIFQNSYKYDYTIEKLHISFTERKKLSILILYIYIKNFEIKNKALSVSDIAFKLNVSINICQTIINELLSLSFLVDLNNSEEHDIRYQVAYDINNITINELIVKLEENGIKNIIKADENNNLLHEKFSKINHLNFKSDDINILIKDL